MLDIVTVTPQATTQHVKLERPSSKVLGTIKIILVGMLMAESTVPKNVWPRAGQMRTKLPRPRAVFFDGAFHGVGTSLLPESTRTSIMKPGLMFSVVLNIFTLTLLVLVFDQVRDNRDWIATANSNITAMITNCQ